MNNSLKQQLFDMQAGCSALSWSTQDQKHLWGRNFDFNRLAEGSKISYIPSGTEYYTCGTSVEHNLAEETRHTSAYAAVGTGFLLVPSTPVLYEGINEKGLMGGQLYYRNFSHFEDKARPGTTKLQPPFAVFHFLAQCATVDEVAAMVEKDVTLMAIPMFGTVPTIHWSFSDRSGESIVIEPDKDGVKIYRNTIGVMTNSPSYSWHRLNLLNYVGVRDLDYDTLELEGDRLEQCFSGNGALGLPGDWSSPSRFIRLAFLKKFGVKGKDEQQGVTNMLHLFQSVAFPLGMIRVSEQGHITEYDKEIVPYDYTIYTSVMCAESLRFYFTSYENQRVQCVDLNHLMASSEKVQFDLGRRADFHLLTSDPGSHRSL
ncbi:Penicillin acylase precursor [Eubacteriaceae bacterium CHKCI005]|nr:Penicillin acylase precursor [Eubacteriaceae bacterium CHKCI005]